MSLTSTFLFAECIFFAGLLLNASACAAASATARSQIRIVNVIRTSLTAKSVEMFCRQVNLPFAGAAARLNNSSSPLYKVCTMVVHQNWPFHIGYL
jgi:hypothetical protein